MEQKTGTSQAPFLSWLIGPLAMLLAIAAIKITGIDFDLNMNTLAPMAVVVIAGIVATLPRVLRDNDSFANINLSLVSLIVAFIGAEIINSFTSLGAVNAGIFFLIVFFGQMLESKERYELSTILTFAGIGYHFSLLMAQATYNSFSSDHVYTFLKEGGGGVLVHNLERAAGAYVFFSYFTISIVVATLAASLARGKIIPAGEEGWFSFLGSNQDGYHKGNLPLQIALAVWALAHIASLWHFNAGSLADQLGVSSEDGYHGYVGYWAAFLTGMVAMIVAGMVSERWNTRAMLLGSMWALYQVSSWNEAGLWTNAQLEGSWGALTWFGITFFICFAIYKISTHEKYGGWANLEDHEYSGARQFWNEHWASLMIGMAFFFGLIIRIQWYIIPSMNSSGTGTWDMTGGSDPWYMKRVVDYILANNAHLVFDADRFYPVGGINPRPPLFTWSLAVGAMILTPFLGENASDAVWWSMLGLPAIYGALTILPVSAIARDHSGKVAGVLAAWLIAFMPAHLTHTTWALADHDAFVLLFITIGFMYWLRAVKYAGSERLSKTTSANLGGLLSSVRDVMTQRQSAFANAVLAGVAFGVASLGWKGFVVGPSILFLAYAVQVALNMFRRRDSTAINVLFLTMLVVNLMMALPFYAHPQLDLVFDGTGLQPFLFILGFTLAISYVTIGFRDKPWLLVLGTLMVGGIIFFGILFVLKFLEMSNAWDVLLTGSGYFAKTKIFDTVAEANAPPRGQLFASFGPILFVISLATGVLLAWEGIRTRKQTSIVFSIWILAACFMSWNAARFMFNATPAVAILGASGMVSLWKWSNWEGLNRSWRKFGIRTPADRITGMRKAVWRTPSFSAILLVMVMLLGQHATYGLDAAIPRSMGEQEMDEDIYNIMPDILRWDEFGFSLLDSSPYDGNWYLGSFGSGFNDEGWNKAYDWLAEQDSDDAYSERPAFVSWWDYGFQALNNGEHPSVSDNFQSGIPATGNMLLARSQEDLVSMFIWQLTEGDIAYNHGNTDNYVMTTTFSGIMDKHLTADEYEELVFIETNVDNDEMISYIRENSFEAYKTNTDVVMARGYHSGNTEPVYRIYDDGERMICTEDLSISCVDGDWSDEFEANRTFSNNVRTGKNTVLSTTHYIIGDYWYTSDLVDEFDSVSTNIHKKNARLALTVQLLDKSLTSAEIIDLYDDIIGMEDYYEVQDYDGAPGETISRDHEIRYFAVDNRLYPRAGRYTADQNYNSRQPMGIFGAPSILSGQDVETFMSTVYETTRGGFEQEMNSEEVDEAMYQDMLNQQSGADVDMLSISDVRVDHSAAFFDTMLARTYVGYGASTLGMDTGDSNPQPAQHFDLQGSPGSYFQQSVPMPGAMLNHFVISNWYSEDPNEAAGQANTYVKILKYYSGAEVSGQVKMSDDGQGLPNVRILLERDAFSGEGTTDLDEDTYWIPIGYTDADENGDWSYTVPAGRIRVSAFAGEFDPTISDASIRSGDGGQNLQDLFTAVNDEREIYDVTAILGHVANMSWLGETEMNVTGQQADRIEDIDNELDIAVKSSGVSGLITWSGHESFAGEAIEDADFILRNIWSMTDNYSITTTSGSFTTEESRILQGTGEVTFTEEGTFDSEGIAFAEDFTGTFTRTIADSRTYFGNGTWNGNGLLEASWLENSSSVIDCETDNETGSIMPANETVCISVPSTDQLTVYLLSGEVNALGSLTSEGTSTLVKTLEGATFEGTGSFAGIGTINGTGLFVGSGHFSGPMVQAGSFYQTGLVPGMYNMIAVLDNGKEVLLPDPVEIGVTPSYDLQLDLPGSIFFDTMKGMDDVIIANHTFELIDSSLFAQSSSDGTTCSISDGCVEITTDEDGNFSYGPITSGEYFYRIDLDNDGWYELNETFNVRSDSENFSLAFAIPTYTDLTISLISPLDTNNNPLTDVSNRTLTFSNDLDSIMTVEATSDENGIIEVELAQGPYTISDETSDEYVLFSSYEVTFDDDAFDLSYAEESWVNGTIRAINSTADYNVWILDEEQKEATSEPASGLAVNFTSGDLFFTTSTDVNGSYSIRLPAGHEFQMTTTSLFTAMSGGRIIDTVPEMSEQEIMYLAPTGYVYGQVFLYDNNTFWDSSNPGFESVTVTATDSTGVEWTTELDDNGGFGIHVPAGLTDVSLPNGLLNSTTVEDFNVVIDLDLSMLELVVNPASQLVTFQVFMDAAGDGEMENGTLIRPAFTLTSGYEFIEDINITSDDYISDGIVEIELQPSAYSLLFNSTSADDANATDYSLTSSNSPYNVYVGLEEMDNYSVVLHNKYLVSGTLTDSNGSGMSTIFQLWNSDGSDWINLESNENGTFAEYVEEGEWIVVVAPFLDDDNGTEQLRSVLNVNADSTRTELTLQTSTSVEVSFTLKEAVTETVLANTRVTLVSQEGLGNITLEKTDADGNVTFDIYPGQWSLFLNNSIPQKQWSLNTSSEPFNITGSNGPVNLGNYSADLVVQIGGKVFWDLNEDDEPGLAEGVPDVNVTIMGSNNTAINETIVTDEQGVWSLFVPIRDIYSVTIDKEGFTSESYDVEETGGFPVYDDIASHDIEMNAGNVSVNGTITDIQGASRLADASIVLYPALDVERDAITITGTMDNDVLTWSAIITPGDWIVVVSENNAGENGGGIAIGLLEASVANGGTLDLEMTLGGWAELTTSWSDIEALPHHAGSDDVVGYSMITEAVVVEVSIGDGIVWEMPIEADGTLKLLLPSGDFDIDSTFITIQHDDELEMKYNAGVNSNVDADRQSLTLEFNRRINSESSVQVVSGSITNATTIEDDNNKLMAGESLSAIEFDVQANYLGTETEDTFAVTGIVEVSPDAEDWNLQFWDESTNEWVESIEVTMGIGANSSDDSVSNSSVIKALLTLPDAATVWHLENGHTIKVNLNTETGSGSEVSINVQVPQTYGFNITGATEEVGIAPSGNRNFEFTLTNDGNGDDTFTIELADNIPSGWEITPTSSTMTIAKDTNRIQMFTAFAPADFTDGSFTVSVTVTSEDGTTTDSFDVTISSARIKLRVDQGDIITKSRQIADEAGNMVIPVENFGTLDATSVIVYLTPQDTGKEMQVGIVIPAGQTVDAVFAMNATSAGNHRFDVRVDVIGDDADDVDVEVEDFDFKMKYQINENLGDESILFQLVILVLVIFVVYGAVKMSRNKSSTKF
jgi:asparagine N-glycosylation enzyme membrane subunit Stt3